MRTWLSERSWQLVRSKWRRALRWEFWPSWVFYQPIVVWIILLTLRYRSLAFLSVNPGFVMSGLFGERKAQALEPLRGIAELARFELISGHDTASRIAAAEQAMQQLALQYPVVLKPDAGQRGSGVSVVRDATALHAYLRSATGPILLQEHIEGEEFGVFYMRHPAAAQGQVFSITEKTFPVIVGDGRSSLEQLLMANSRTHYMAAFLLRLHADKLSTVLAAGSQFKVVEIGSHCRGSVFLDANALITPDLAATMHTISAQIPGFFFGRFDLRVPNKVSLRAGQGIKVLEVNGVTSESTNMYDPSHSVFKAYKIMFKQWSKAFEIGQANINHGAARVSLLQLVRYLVNRSKPI